MPKTLTRIAALATTVVVGGLLGQMLAVPPGYASPIWPPAGIILAALLIWGRRLTPGAWIGSFLLNLWIGGGAPGQFSNSVVLAAAVIATGSTLQALAAVWLSRRWIGREVPRLDNPRDILFFILLTGLLPCLIAPTIGVGTLVSTGIVPTQTALFSWWNWWIGDSLGVIIVTPLIFCLFAQPRALWRPRRLTLLLPLSATLIALIAAFILVRSAENTRIQLEFDIHAATIEKTLNERFEHLISGSFVVRDVFQASHEIERAEFATLSRAVLQRYPEIQALEWLPRVPQAELQAFELSVRKEGFSDFRVKEFDAKGNLVPVSARDEYFPVFYLEPLAGNEKAFGLDSAANPLSRASKDISRATGKPTISQRLKLVQETGHYYAVLVSIPVYESIDAQNRGNLKGFVTGLVRPGQLVEFSIKGLEVSNLHIAVHDMSAPPEESVLFLDPGIKTADAGPNLHPWQKDFKLADRTWRITVAPDRDFPIKHGSALPWITLFGGLCFTGLLGVYLLTISGRAAHIESLVEQRTQDLRDSEMQAQHLAQNMAATLEAIPDLLFELDGEGRYIAIKARRERLLAAPMEQLIGQRVIDVMPTDSANTVLDALSVANASGADYGRIIHLPLPDGDHWFELSVARKGQAGVNNNTFIVLSRDVTERIRAEEKLRLSARVFADTHEGITITDADGTIIDVNPTFCRITGYSREEMIGQKTSLLKSGRQGPEFYQAMWKALTETGHWQGEVWNRKKNGVIYAELLTISAMHDEQGNTMNYVGLFSDITQIKQQQQTLELMAHYDALTQLPNRALFADRFSQAIARANRDKSQLAVCYIDLDGFKQVNDMLGHETGDYLLIEVADRIKSGLRQEDTVSRLGGDEFALLLGDMTSLEQCEQTLDRIHQAIAEPYRIAGETVLIAASSGVTLYPQDNSDPDTLLRHADQAMYQAKQQGRNRYFFFDPEQDQQVQKHRNQLHVVEDAFTRREFCLYYQPKVNMKTGEVIGAEALIRWNHPERGILPPSEFLPIIMGTHLEAQVGRWVIEQALDQLDQWRKQGLNLQVSINISPRHLQSPGFYGELDAALAKHPDVYSRKLELEVLESSAMDNLHEISRVIDECFNLLGVPFALDDFGTGYSSLTHMRHLQASTVKIDQSFVRDMVDDPDDFAIVEGVIGLSKAFRREVIAEGVETAAHGQILISMDCHLGQGYAIARPMPAEALPAWVETWKPFKEWQKLGAEKREAEEAQLLILRMELDQWLARMQESLMAQNTEEHHWPIHSGHKCHLGRWIIRAKRDGKFDQDRLANLEQVHEELHHIAGELRQKYQDGKFDEAREGIKRMQSVHKVVKAILGQLLG